MRFILCYILGSAIHAIAAPTILWKRQSLVKDWPEMCGDVNLRGKTQWEVEEGSKTPREYGFFLSSASITNTDDAYTVWRDNQGDDGASLLDWAAQVRENNFGWDCNTASCNIANFQDECKEDEGNAQFGLILESAANLYKFLKSLSDAIETSRTSIGLQLPSMFDTFGARSNEDADWATAIGVITGAVGTYAAVLTALAPAAGAAAEGVTVGLDLVSAISGYLIPKEEEEKNFARYAEAAKSFDENTKVILKAIDDYIDTQFLKKVDGTTTTDIQKALKNEQSFLNMIKDGTYAGRNTPLVQKTDGTVMASLSAPIINAIWNDARYYVIKFNGPSWKAQGFDLCGEGTKVFEDIQPTGKSCDGEGSLYMIANWNKGGPNWKNGFRSVVGLESLADFSVTPQQVIDGSIANYDANGFQSQAKLPSLIDRLRGITDPNSMQLGILNVWNLPFCDIGPSKSGNPKSDLEEYMAGSALGCPEAMTDRNGKTFKDVYGETPPLD